MPNELFKKKTDIEPAERIGCRTKAYETFFRPILKKGKGKSVVNNNELNRLWSVNFLIVIRKYNFPFHV